MREWTKYEDPLEGGVIATSRDHFWRAVIFKRENDYGYVISHLNSHGKRIKYQGWELKNLKEAIGVAEDDIAIRSKKVKKLLRRSKDILDRENALKRRALRGD
jgi:hypothetical protein